jgi:hypothetical protein
MKGSLLDIQTTLLTKLMETLVNKMLQNKNNIILWCVVLLKTLSRPNYKKNSKTSKSMNLSIVVTL